MRRHDEGPAPSPRETGPSGDSAASRKLNLDSQPTANGDNPAAPTLGGPTTESYGPSTVKRQRRTNLELEAVNEAIFEAVREENPVTLRGVFYRVVSAGAVDKSEAGYRLVGRQLLKLRRAKVIPYAWITDGTRLIRKPPSWSAIDEMLEDAAASYRRALWHDQDVEVLVLSEKDAISGVVYPITAAWDVELGIVRGYSSETFAYSVAESIASTDKTTYVYQLGDHDPSGVDAWRSFEEKVRGFVPDVDAVFERLAVTPEQIHTLSLPTRPTKSTDTRSRGFAGESVEVDAIPAPLLRQIVENAITQHIDPSALDLTYRVEQQERNLLTAIAAGGAQ
jgi:hypothetical protein